MSMVWLSAAFAQQYTRTVAHVCQLPALNAKMAFCSMEVGVFNAADLLLAVPSVTRHLSASTANRDFISMAVPAHDATTLQDVLFAVITKHAFNVILDFIYLEVFAQHVIQQCPTV